MSFTRSRAPADEPERFLEARFEQIQVRGKGRRPMARWLAERRLRLADEEILRAVFACSHGKDVVSSTRRHGAFSLRIFATLMCEEYRSCDQILPTVCLS